MAEHEESSGGVPPLDEEAAWAAIVAGYGQEPADPPGARPFRPIENLMLPEEDVQPEPGVPPEKAGPAGPPVLGSSVVFAPGVGVGPRDHAPADPSSDPANSGDSSDEGHFVPPEPPPLPSGDVTSRFAWLAVVGGPLLLLVAVLLQWEMTWWLTTLGIGGFLGGFATLVARMTRGDDDEDDHPGRGAVV
ncbi:hypothetical protein OHS33_09890 [Streptomyces sp. NBC_00536]|uniref:hypothetical protein n=1 Tax=Streptomyces sp. NBC_00536 TaxID=2975769 RepID=UPI002E804788|nr:hypothetical protein [Streptomyces sp. NBC_00536]WUC78622.1 hypothetical protein OHS33_09890 [Streptomyces sp. NBC_00536]